MGERDDFNSKVKRVLADRVGSCCSNPDCCVLTAGPQTDPSKSLNVGVAAHITAAAPRGPRYDPGLPEEGRRGASNGIWLCQNCAKLVDNDPVRFTEELLRAWKTVAEYRALHSIGKTSAGEAVRDKWVDIHYPEKIGIVADLKEKGYKLYWSKAGREATRIDIEGWDYVLVDGPDGRQSRLKVKDASAGYLVLLKKRIDDTKPARPG